MRPFVLVLCLLSSLPALAQETRYRLERIVVEGSNISEDIVRGESRLEEEQSYTEEDFRQAVYRIRRLPFVTDAVYRIDSGLTPGGTTLVIRILDVTPAFYDLQVVSREDVSGERELDGSALLGGRWLLDNLGVVEGAVRDGKDEDGIQVGLAYRAYDIYGTGGYASIALAQRFKAEERTYDPDIVFLLGYPLTRRQSVTLSASRSKSRITRDFDRLGDDDEDDDDDTDRDDNLDLTDRSHFHFAELRWLFESTDDPFFATRGMTLSAGPRWLSSMNSVERFDEDEDEIVSDAVDETAYGFALNADAYRPLVGRTVGFLRLEGVGSRTEESEAEILDGSARAGVAYDFHANAPGVLRAWKARVEANGGYRTIRAESPTTPRFSDSNPFAEAAFSFRHRWGTVRVAGTYLFD